MKLIDRLFSALLLLGAAGHTLGTFAFYTWPSEIFVWSLGSSLAAFLLGAINLLRVSRSSDRALALTCAIGAAGWLMIVIAFGIVEGNFLDVRIMMHSVAAFGLIVMSVRMAARRFS